MNGRIYQVINKINGKQYVGQTIMRDELGHGIAIGSAYKKYGRNNFSYHVLSSNIKSQNLLNYLENFFISLAGSMAPNGYNLAKGGKGGDIHTLEAIRKMSEHQKKLFEAEPERKQRLADVCRNRVSPLKGRKIPREIVEKMVASRKGIKRSPEQVEKMRIASTGRKYSEETKAKLSAIRKVWANSPEGKAVLSKNGKNSAKNYEKRKEQFRQTALIREAKKREKRLGAEV